MPSPPRTHQRRVGASDIAAGCEYDRQAAGGAGVAVRVREAVGPFRSSEIAALLAQCAKIECAVRLAALVRALVELLRCNQIAVRFMEHAEVERRARMAQRIGVPVSTFGAGQVTPAFERNGEAEAFYGTTGAVDKIVCAPHEPLEIFEIPLSTTQNASIRGV